MQERRFRIVKLLEPELCAECRFAEIEVRETGDGGVQKVVHCRRGDCDNWETLDRSESSNRQS